MAKRSSQPKGKPVLQAATYYRLKGAVNGKPVANAADFIESLVSSPLLGRHVESGTEMFLYGYSVLPRQRPAFAEFLTPFQISVPDSPRYAYVIIIRIETAGGAWYALPFGNGRFLLKDEVIDREAPLDIAIKATSSKDPNRPSRYRQLRTKQVGPAFVTVQKRASQDSSLGELQFDPYSEILDELDGRPSDVNRFGTALTAGAGLNARRPVELSDLPMYLATLEETVHEQPPHDLNVANAMYRVRDVDLLRQLDEALVAAVRDVANDEVSFAIPEFIRYDAAPVIHFSRVGVKGKEFTDDIDMATYRQYLIERDLLDSVDLEFLQRSQAVLEDGKQYSVYRCLTGSVEIGGCRFIYNDRSWYRLPANLLAEANEQLDLLPPWTMQLPPPVGRVTEPQYNKNVGIGEFLLLDARSLQLQRGEAPIEVCDLLTMHEDKLAFVHVKRDFASSSLSHLFAQGRVSAIALQEAEWRSKVHDFIQGRMKLRSPKPNWSRRLNGFLAQGQFRPEDITVVYAILGSWDGQPLSKRLPFFSKLVLRRALTELRGREFNVSIASVQMPGPSANSSRPRKRKAKKKT